MAETAKQLDESVISETYAINLESYRLEHRNRILGSLAIKPEQRLRNNDPLAHIFLRLEAGRFTDIELQVRAEYRGDMSERSDITSQEVHDSKASPILTSLDYALEGDDLIYTKTGKSMNEMLRDGVIAAQDDYDLDREKYAYHLERAKVLAEHGPAIVEWRNSCPQSCAMIASLCPPEWELSADVAEVGSFKPNRGMASIWILEPTDIGIHAQIFSLDGLTPERLQFIYDSLGLNVQVEETTLKEVAKIRQLNHKGSAKAVSDIWIIYDTKLDEDFPENGPHFQGIAQTPDESVKFAYDQVLAKPEAESMYMEAVEEVAQSLISGKVTSSLIRLASVLRQACPPQNIPAELQIGWGTLDLERAREFMDYLRKRALSEYIFGDQDAHNEFRVSNGTNDNTWHSKVASAGAYASANGISREGDCPPSRAESSADLNSEASKAMGIHQGANKGRCVKCKFCSQIVDLPEKLLKKNIIHCVRCKASVHKNGGKVDQKLIDEYYRAKPKSEESTKESDWQRIVREDNEKKALQKQKRLEEQSAKRAA